MFIVDAPFPGFPLAVFKLLCKPTVNSKKRLPYTATILIIL